MEENRSVLDMGVDQDGVTQLTETARWSKLMAILVLVGMGLMALLMFFMWATFMESFTMSDVSGTSGAVGVMFAIIFSIAAVIVIILMSFLLKGANRIRLGIQSKDQVLFNSGLANLKNYFVMYGVIAIIGMVFTLIGLLGNQ